MSTTHYRVYLSVRTAHDGKQVADITHSVAETAEYAESRIELFNRSGNNPIYLVFNMWRDIKDAMIDLYGINNLLFIWMKEAITE